MLLFKNITVLGTTLPKTSVLDDQSKLGFAPVSMDALINHGFRLTTPRPCLHSSPVSTQKGNNFHPSYFILFIFKASIHACVGYVCLLVYAHVCTPGGLRLTPGVFTKLFSTLIF